MNNIVQSQMIDKAVNHKRQGEYSQALSIYNSILSESNDFHAYYARGKLHFILEDYEKSLQDYLNSIYSLIESNGVINMINQKDKNLEAKRELNRIIAWIKDGHFKHIGAAYRCHYRDLRLSDYETKSFLVFIKCDYRRTIDPYFSQSNKPIVKKNMMPTLNELLVDAGRYYCERFKTNRDFALLMKEIENSLVVINDMPTKEFSYSNSNAEDILNDEVKTSSFIKKSFEMINSGNRKKILEAGNLLISLYAGMEYSTYQGKMEYYHGLFNLLNLMEKNKLEKGHFKSISKKELLKKALIEGTKSASPYVNEVAESALHFYVEHKDYTSALRILDFETNVFMEDKIISYLQRVIVSPEIYNNREETQDLISMLDYYTQKAKIETEDVELSVVPEILYYIKLSTLTGQAHLFLNNEIQQYANRLLQSLKYIKIILDASPKSFQFSKMYIEIITSLLSVCWETLSTEEITYIMNEGVYWSRMLKMQKEVNASKIVEQFIIQRALVIAKKYNEIREAREILTSEITVDENPAVINALGEISMLEGNYPNAIWFFERSSLNEQDYNTLYLMSQAFLHLERYTDSERYILMARSMLNEDFKKLILDFSIQNDVVSNGYIQQALWLKKKEISINSISILRDNQKYETAESIFHEEIKYFSNDPYFQFLNTSLKRTKKRNEEMTNHLERVMKEAKENTIKLKKYQDKYKEIIKSILHLKQEDYNFDDSNEIEKIENEYHKLAIDFMNKTFEDKNNRKSYNNIQNKINKNFVNLSDKSKKFLLTAEYLYENHRDMTFDFSPIMIEYGKILEEELTILLRGKRLINNQESARLYDLINKVSQYTNHKLPYLKGFDKPANTVRINRNTAAHPKLCNKKHIQETRKILLNDQWLKRIIDSK
ncbi:hypothetical protein [Alkalibacterium olivapovliticus]|uniref:Tetratricopeptide repeat protein n=1 Tax=Alkalibacterium olivapovliticus TaxID=99907 RepID=A0A2T0W3S8_9LACT|nr:hypothetical protein [Alkalibacterium olivapovliticus]PRY80136.1 hypothetical protein CLV38_12126 [Alkalibacterium olivapovliticus]